MNAAAEHHRVWRIAGPIILSNVSVPLLGAVDTAVVGHLDSPIYLGGVAIGSLVFSYVYWGFGFLRMGTTGLAAQATGARDGRFAGGPPVNRNLTSAIVSGNRLCVVENHIDIQGGLDNYIIKHGVKLSVWRNPAAK